MKIINPIMKGLSQVLLQSNNITGLLILIGILYNSIIMGVGAMIGVVVSTYVAKKLRYREERIDGGYYGFNGVLVGIGVLSYYEMNILILLLIILGSSLTCIIMNWMEKRGIAPYTFPFVLMTWLLLFFINENNIAIATQFIELADADIDLMSSLGKGLGQIMFQENSITGMIFLIGIIIRSRIGALYAATGVLLSSILAYYLSVPLDLVNRGLFGFNGGLCGLAFADQSNRYSFWYAVLAIVLSLFVTQGMVKCKLLPLTVPFVISTWMVMGAKRYIGRLK